MKYIELSIVCLLLLCFSSCEDEYTAVDFVSDATLYTSITPGEPNYVEQGSFVSIMDLSRGTISHAWTIEEGNHFLKTGFTSRDSLPLFIDEQKGLTTTDPTIHILFEKTGINKVRLQNTFSEYVSYNGEELVEAILDGNVWVFDHTLEFDVFGPIKPAFKVFKGETEIMDITSDMLVNIEEKEKWDTLKIEVGDTLRFVDFTAEGRPTSREWTIKRGTPETNKDSVNTVVYYSLGESTVMLTLLRAGDYPKATEKKYAPLIISVGETKKPFVYAGSLTRIEPNKISFRVSGQVASIGDELSNFTVHVKNEQANFNETIAVVETNINNTDKTIIELTLESEIYASDLVTLSYQPKSKSTIKTVDKRTLKQFDEKPLEFGEEANGFDSEIFGFEVEGKEWFFQHSDQWGLGEEKAHSGEKSLKFSASISTAPTKMKVQSVVSSNPISLTQGDYIMSLDIWIDPNSEITNLDTNLDTPWIPIKWSLEGVKKGSWETISQEIAYGGNSDPASSKIILQIAKSYMKSDDVLMYIDNIKMIKKEDRPIK